MCHKGHLHHLNVFDCFSITLQTYIMSELHLNDIFEVELYT